MESCQPLIKTVSFITFLSAWVMKHNGRIIRSAECVTVISASEGKHLQGDYHDFSVYSGYLA